MRPCDPLALPTERNEVTQAEQINAFSDELGKVVDRFRKEFEISLAAAIGVLELAKLDLVREMHDGDHDDAPPAPD